MCTEAVAGWNRRSSTLKPMRKVWWDGVTRIFRVEERRYVPGFGNGRSAWVVWLQGVHPCFS